MLLTQHRFLQRQCLTMHLLGFLIVALTVQYKRQFWSWKLHMKRLNPYFTVFNFIFVQNGGAAALYRNDRSSHQSSNAKHRRVSKRRGSRILHLFLCSCHISWSLRSCGASTFVLFGSALPINDVPVNWNALRGTSDLKWIVIESCNEFDSVRLRNQPEIYFLFQCTSFTRIINSFFHRKLKFFFFYFHLRAVYEAWRLLMTLHQLHGLPLAVFIHSMHPLRMSLVVIDSKWSILPSNVPNSETNRLNADAFFFCLYRSRTSSETFQYSHEICNVESEQSGPTSLLRRQDNDNIAKNRSLSLKIHRLKSSWRKICGYRFAVLLCAGLTATVALINLTLTIWASKRFDVIAGFGTIQQGNCDQTKKLSLWLHFAINVLSTALLSASNYTMQCLSSPTRQEIDKAHAKKGWLDIGVPSVRNLKGIAWKRIILWWLLAITSLPLHLMYNSAIFDTLSSHQYDAYLVSKEFLSGAPYNITESIVGWTKEFLRGVPYNTTELITEYEHVQGFPLEHYTRRLDSFRNPNADMKLKHFNSRECMSTYVNGFATSKYKDVLAVCTINNATNSLLDVIPNEIPSYYDWHDSMWGCIYRLRHEESWCDAGNNILYLHWRSSFCAVEHCLVQEVDEKCLLQFSLSVMLIIIICNLIKIACMILVVLEGESRPMVTVGDAIASFLNEPDPATKNLCLADINFFRNESSQTGSLVWKPERHRWFRAASIRRWLICNILWVIRLLKLVGEVTITRTWLNDGIGASLRSS